MPHPKPVTLQAASRDGVAGLAIVPAFAPNNPGAEAVATLPPALDGSRLVFSGIWQFAWWATSCPDVVSLQVAASPSQTIINIGLNIEGVVVCAIEGAGLGFVGLTPGLTHQFKTRLYPGSYRAYAAAGDQVLVDEEEPVSIYSCALDVVDVDNFIVSNRTISLMYCSRSQRGW